MARKRDRSKRKNYQKGGRVFLKHGGRPSRRDYGSGDEYQVALEQWKSDPAHSATPSVTPYQPNVGGSYSNTETPKTDAENKERERTTLGPDNLKDKRRKGRPDRPTGVKAAITPPSFTSFPKVTGTTKGRPSTTTTVTERVKERTKLF